MFLFLLVYGCCFCFMYSALLDPPSRGIFGSIEQSVRLAVHDLPRIATMLVIIGVTACAGLLACCVGVLVSVGLAAVIHATLYVALCTPPAAGAAAPHMPAS